MKLKVTKQRKRTYVSGTNFIIDEKVSDETKDLDKIELNFRALEIIDAWTRDKNYYSSCPFLGKVVLGYDKTRCKIACNEIFPKAGSPIDRCPCCVYDGGEVLIIVKKVIENFKKRSLMTRVGLFFIRLYRWESKLWQLF